MLLLMGFIFQSDLLLKSCSVWQGQIWCNVGWDARDLFSRLGKLLSSRLCQKISFCSPLLCRAACFPRHEVSHSCTETLFASFLPEKCNSWPMTLNEVNYLSHHMKSKIRFNMELWLNAFNYVCSCKLTGLDSFFTWKKNNWHMFCSKNVTL